MNIEDILKALPKNTIGSIEAIVKAHKIRLERQRLSIGNMNIYVFELENNKKRYYKQKNKVLQKNKEENSSHEIKIKPAQKELNISKEDYKLIEISKEDYTKIKKEGNVRSETTILNGSIQNHCFELSRNKATQYFFKNQKANNIEFTFLFD